MNTLFLGIKDKYMNKKTITILTFSLLLISIIAVSVYYYWYNSYYIKLPKINILIAPKSSTVTLNDKKITSSGDYHTEAGDYVITISKEGFETKSENFTLKEGETKQIALYLASNNTSTADWYNNNKEDAEIVQSISSINHDIEVKEYKEKYPIIDILPYTNGRFTIKAKTVSSSSKPIITIYIITSDADNDSVKQQLRNDALDYLKGLKDSHGIDINDYYIKYEN